MESQISELKPVDAPISRRDFFAGLALAGLLANEGDSASVATLADIAVAHADQLLAALDAAETSSAGGVAP